MKLNNKGFTVVELLASFVLTMIIVVFLFEIVLELKNVYINETVRTEVINKNAVVASSINNVFENQYFKGINCSSETSCKVPISNNVEGAATLYNIPITVDKDTKTVTIDKQKIVYSGKTQLTNVKLSVNPSEDNTIFRISYDIESADLNKPIKFNLIYSYKG